MANETSTGRKSDRTTTSQSQDMANMKGFTEIDCLATSAEVGAAGDSQFMLDVTKEGPDYSANEWQGTAQALTDAELIAAARGLSVSVQFHLRKSVEEFWRLGEALARLHDRPSVKGRWREVLKEIGVNHTTDNHARRLYIRTTMEDLAGYKNKSAALRALGILAEPAPAKKRETPDRASKPAPKTTDVAQDVGVTVPETPVAGLAAGDENAQVGGGRPDRSNNVDERHPDPAAVAEEDPSPLATLARIAARLEYLVGEDFEITPEVAAQVERVVAAAKRLQIRAEGVVRAAA
jgi:hypothetical protein